jgi:hypothetical protein
MVGIERIKIIEVTDYLKERSEMAAQYIEPINAIYKEILPLADGEQTTEVSRDELKGRYDATEGIDIILTLKDGSRLTLQEKCLFKGFHTVTFETEKRSGKKGAWYYCTSQLYFCAEASKGEIISYVLLDLLQLKIHSNKHELPWKHRKGIERSHESFMFMRFSEVPEECIIARKL